MSFLRMDRGIVRGKRFASRKKAAEYVFRSKDGFVDGQKPTNFDQRSISPPRAHDPNKPCQGDYENGPVRRVYRHGLLWRVTVADIWQSDHATMDDALAGVNPIGVEPGTIAPNVKVQSGADYD